MRLLLAAIAVCVCAQALGQPARRTAVIGYLAPVVAQNGPDIRLEGFRKGMRDLGYTEAKDYRLEIRSAAGKTERLDALARELAGMKVEVILASSLTATLAARRATKTIPIVMGNIPNPVENGAVASLARPGGNVTGVANFGGDLTVKQFAFLKTMVPTLSRVALLYNPDQPRNRVEGVTAAAHKAGVQPILLQARSVAEIERAFARMRDERPDALMVLPDPFFLEQRVQMVKLANEARLPAMYNSPQVVDAGGLMSYGTDLGEFFRHAARYVDRILKGAKPADLAVEQPVNVGLVINRKTAQAIGIPIPG